MHVDTLEMETHNDQDTNLCVAMCNECYYHIFEFQCTKTIVYVVITVISQTQPFRRYVFCTKCTNKTRMRHNARPMASSVSITCYLIINVRKMCILKG